LYKRRQSETILEKGGKLNEIQFEVVDTTNNKKRYIVLSSECLTSLFGADEDVTYKYRKLAELPVRRGGLSLSNPTTNSKECFESSTLYCSQLLSALRGRVVDSLVWQSEAMPENWSRIEAGYKTKFISEVDQFP